MQAADGDCNDFGAKNKVSHCFHCFCIYHFMANGWGNSGRLYFFLNSKITADGDCSHEIKRRLLLGRKVMTNLDTILKSRHYFVNKGSSSQGYGFSSGSALCIRWPKYWSFSFSTSPSNEYLGLSSFRMST